MLTADRTLLRKMGPRRAMFAGPVAAGAALFRGSIAAVCPDGTLVPAGTQSPLFAPVAILGIAKHQQLSTSGGLVTGDFVGSSTAVECETGCFALPFDTAPSWANKGQPVYAVDDQTVSLTQTPSGGTARLQVGVLAGLDVDGTPYVEI